jgi:hypothetical protein
MPIISQIICDGCKAVKKEANHWYTLVISDTQEASLRPMAKSRAELFHADVAGVQYLCGRRCVSEALDRWMDGLTTREDSGVGGPAKCTYPAMPSARSVT